MTSEKPIESVKCDVCDTIFTECFSASTNQAYGCASDFYQTNEKSYVLSSYGSKYDTTRFNVLPSSNLNGKYGVVCDECIKALIERKEISEDRKTQVGSGDRSERIRTYNYPQGRLTDHRINLTLYRLAEIMEGDIEEIIESLGAHHTAELLQKQKN